MPGTDARPPSPARHAPSAPIRPYAELHARSNFSFLEGASHPEELVDRAAELGLAALALTDRNGLYGIVRFARAARGLALRTAFGAELECGEVRDGARDRLVLLADGPEGYVRLSRAITEGQLAGAKDAPRFDLGALAAHGAGAWWVLTAAERGGAARALAAHGPAAAERQVRLLVDAFGRDCVLVELWHHGDPIDTVRNDALVHVAGRVGVGCVATNDVAYARPPDHRLATAFAAVRAGRTLDEMDPRLPPAGTACLRSGAEQHRRFGRYPGTVERALEVATAATFDLALVAPRLPPFECPPGHDESSWLRELVHQGAHRRYGPPPVDPLDRLSLRARAWATIRHELEVIETLGFAGYFLVVWDIVEFCRRHDILCQGRGSAANSAVCFALGVTKADAVSLGLLFERFLSPERDGPPDIDLDIESGRREEVIQYVYARHGRGRAAQVANVVTYRERSALRDMARVGASGDAALLALDAPRHLGLHSGGMVICDRPVGDVCPVEWARMAGRSVLQWDKDDCAAIGLVKFDLLGLGMLSALHRAVDLVARHRGTALDLATLPQEDEVYAMLCRADSVGVFQVESRAQMATLPRLKPRRFYDLVVEIALIRPGPIQGDSVHPYIRRRNGQEPVTYLHPLLEPSLGKTLGVPLFQEQLMQMAIDVAGFTAAEADELRQAMGSTRSRARMRRLEGRLYAGMARRGITGAVADEIYAKMAAFATYGFPESHSVSFAYLVYASAWIKYHEPAVFCAALLDSQPMGFWSPHSLVRDARRHGVVVRTPDLVASEARTTLEPCAESTGGLAVRLGIGSVRGIGDALAREIEAGRPYRDMEDLARRVPALTRTQLEALATAGAFVECVGAGRRDALWAAGAVAQSRPDRLHGVATGTRAPVLPGMAPLEEAIADLWATGIAPDGHPTQFFRERLRALGVCTADELGGLGDGVRVVVAGVVTHRQRPPTAGGVTFVNVEDETGHVNVIVSRGCWRRHERAASASSILVRGRLRCADGAINLEAERIDALGVPARIASRDYH